MIFFALNLYIHTEKMGFGRKQIEILDKSMRQETHIHTHTHTIHIRVFIDSFLILNYIHIYIKNEHKYAHVYFI